MVMERIMPLPKVIRENLIKQYFPKDMQLAALVNPDSQDCITRAYLGVRWADLDKAGRAESVKTLRNSLLYPDEMHHLDMNPKQISMDMSLGLASVHWIAHIDMGDVEFVIASRPTRVESYTRRSDHPVRSLLTSFDTQICMFGFDKDNKFVGCACADKGTMRNLAEALIDQTLTNDPFYPTSTPETRENYLVWKAV